MGKQVEVEKSCRVDIGDVNVRRRSFPKALLVRILSS